jgi:hypothetical protein
MSRGNYQRCAAYSWEAEKLLVDLPKKLWQKGGENALLLY